MKPVTNMRQNVKTVPQYSFFGSLALFFSAGNQLDVARQALKESSLKTEQIIEQTDRTIADRARFLALGNQAIEKSKARFSEIDNDIAKSIAGRGSHF